MKNETNLLVSVLVVTYNHEAFIENAILGVLLQSTDFEYELVIGEDSSTDKTFDICKKYQRKFPQKIKLFSNRVNLGLNLNYLQTLKRCQGKYIAYLEGDDYWKTKDKLQKQINILEKNFDVSLVHTNCCLYNNYNNTVINRIISFEGICPREKNFGVSSICAEFEGNFRPIKTSTCVYRRSMIEEIISDDYFLFANKEFPTQDFQLFQELSLRGKFCFLDEETTVITLHESISHSSNIEKTIKFSLGFFEIGIYLVDKYQLPQSTLNIWLQKQIFKFQKFGIVYGRSQESLYVTSEAQKRGYRLNWRQLIKQSVIYLISIYNRRKCRS